MPSLNPKTNTLGFAKAAHLLKRTVFCPSKTLINQYAAYTPQQALSNLFITTTPDVPEPLAYDTGLPWVPTPANPSPVSYTITAPYVSNMGWWIRKAEKTSSIHAKLSLFLHSIFITNQVEEYGSIFFAYDYLALIDFYADKSIKTFAKKTSRLNAMHYYLDNRLNTKNSPNENYAREFLELFTITKGAQDGAGSYTTYTELDVQQAAKVLTGFTNISPTERLSYLDADCNIPLGKKVFSNHDTNSKTFSAKFGSQTIAGATNATEMDTELDTFIDMVFAQQATAVSYAKRLYRYFVRRDISTEVETDIITPLANHLLANDYNLASAASLLLQSVHFYDEDDAIEGDEVIGAKIKSPLELALIMVSQFKIQSPNPLTQTQACYFGFYYNFIWSRCNSSGFPLLRPFNVAGYPALYESPDYDKLWINTANLKNRYDLFIGTLLSGYATTKLDIVDYVHNSGDYSNPANSTTLVNEFLELCLAEIPSGTRYSYFSQALLGNLSAINWQNEWNTYISTGNKASVKIALERFVKAVVQSPEYQLF